MTKRKAALEYAKIAGYHNDTKSFTRLIIESRVNRNDMDAAWMIGVNMKTNGTPCKCPLCS